MKKYLLILAAFIFIASGCQKDTKVVPVNPNASPNIKLDLKHSFSQSVDGNGVTTTITYISNGNYDIKVSIPSAFLRPSTGYTYVIYSTSGNSLPNQFTNQGITWETTYKLLTGTGFIAYSNPSTGYAGNSNNFTITAQPAVPDPAQGWVGLYRYYDSDSPSRHYYTNTWEELGSFSQGYEFEKLQGVMYDNATRAPNLIPLYRYYNATSNDHYLTTTMGTYAGYTYDKIIGYISSAASSSTFLQLNEYYSSAGGHVYTSPPEVPSGFTFDTTLGYFPASTSPQIVYEFYNATAGKHAYSFDLNLPAGNPTYSLNGQPFLAYETTVASTVPVYQFYNNSTQDHVLTTNANPGFPAGYNSTGVAFYTYTSAINGSVPIYEFYSTNGVDHFYSANSHAADPYPSYHYNAQPFYALPPTSTPQKVYEYYNGGKHAYSLTYNATNNNGQPFMAYPVYIPGTVAVYVFYNSSSKDHVLTTNINPGWAGYAYSSTVFYAYTTNVAGSVPLYEFYSSSGVDHFYSTDIHAADPYPAYHYNGQPFYVIPN